MRRREFITFIGFAASYWPVAVGAQQDQHIRRIGVLLPSSASDPEFQHREAVLRQALGELGWTNRNTVFEPRFAEGKIDRLPALAAELVKARVDVIVTQGTFAAEAARGATRTIPIVMAAVGDAVGIGMVPSLARPGGNVTGLTLVATEQSAKRLQLIEEISPGLSRVAVFWSADNASHRLQLKEMEATAVTLGLRLQSLPVRNADEFEGSFQAAIQGGAQAIITMDDPLIASLRARIAKSALRHKLAVMGEFRPMTAAGGLMNYGPDQIEMWRRSAAYIDKIFHGSNPADLPIERPTKFELIVNMRTAKALGIDIPPTLLARADEVIE